MLPALPLPPSPGPPGANALPLSHGGAHPQPPAQPSGLIGAQSPAQPGLPFTGAASMPAPAMPAPATPAALPLLPASLPPSARDGPPLPEAAAKPEAAPGSTTVALPAQAMAASTAAPMSLVAAQMMGGEVAAMQNLLAQQAATRALPTASARRTPPAPSDAAPAAADHTPDGAFNPQAPHAPQLMARHGNAAEAAPLAARLAALAQDPALWAEVEEIARQMPLVTAPGSARLPLRPATLWTIVGTLCAGVFILALLTS